MNQLPNSKGKWYYKGEPVDWFYHMPIKREGHPLSPVDFLLMTGREPTDKTYGPNYEQLKEDGYEYVKSE